MDIPKPLRLPSPDRLEIRSGGGCMAVFGLPFLLAGVFVTLIGLSIVPLNNASEVPAWAWPVMILMGLVFVGAGGAIVFGRRAIIIETGRGMISRQWGLLVPMKTEESSLSEFSTIAIEFQAGDSDSADRYPVKLLPRSSDKSLTLTSPIGYADALRHAQFVARFLRFPLKDRSSDHEIVLTPDKVDLPFRDRLRLSRSNDRTISRPPETRSELQESTGEARITIPGPGWSPTLIFRFAIPFVPFLFILLQLAPFLRRSDTPDGVQWFFFGFAGLMLLLPLLGAFAAAVHAFRGKTVVSVSREGIALEEREAWRTRSVKISADSILDLDFGTTMSSIEAADERIGSQRLPPPVDSTAARWAGLLKRFVSSKGVMVKANSGVYTFGRGLPDEEVRYLYAVVRRVLAGD
jgi:hypothetical protein